MKLSKKHLLLLLLYVVLPFLISAQTEEFYGPFPSWANLKKNYQAVGDSITDDTKAIQKALDDLGENGHSPVLFIPNGTYRITATLTMKTKKGIVIMGEDPLKTIIKWDGKAGEKMFFLNGVSYSEYGRITWNGNNKASVAYAHEWDGKVQFANSGSQHADEVFINIGVGIKSGSRMDAEMSIRRCRFYNCSTAGISLQGANALDWWIWDCYFENCYLGVTNYLPVMGAGNFHIYRCIFNRSTNSDILLGNSNYFSFRDNISYNSTRFLRAMQFSNTSPLTIQNNTIITGKNSEMLDLYTKGNLLLMNNLFITPDTGKNYIISHVDNYKNSTPDITLIGNRFTAKNKLIKTEGGRVSELDTKPGIKKPKLPAVKPYAFAPLVNYPVTEITDSISTEALQKIISSIAAKKKKTILHFKYGRYNFSKPLLIPAAAPVIFYGDGLRSVVALSKIRDTLTDAVIKINSPAKCTIRSIWIQGTDKTDGIVVYDDDKTGNIIYGNQLLLFNAIKTNLWVNGFASTSFRLENFQHNYCFKGTSVKMIGSGKKNNSLLKIFGGECAANNNSYEVNKGGRILVYDAWYEGNNDQFISLKGNGEFYANGAKIAATNYKPGSFITIDSFSGKAVIAQAIYNSPAKKISFNNNTGKASFLTLGTLSWNDSTVNIYNVKGSPFSYSMYNNRYNVGKGSYPLPNIGDTTHAFIKKMMRLILQTSVQKDKPLKKPGAQLSFERVMIDGARNNLRIEKAPSNKK